jgi:hypothetical protein
MQANTMLGAFVLGVILGAVSSAALFARMNRRGRRM